MESELDYLDFGDDLGDGDVGELIPVNPDLDLEPNDTNEDNNESNSNELDGSGEDDSNNNEGDVLTLLLKSKGIKDPSAIKQIDDDGNITEIDFNSLTTEEQLNILNSSDADNNYGLEPTETELINLLRENNLSVEDYLNYVKQQAIEEFISENNTPQYEIDNLSDDELYLLDLKQLYSDITEAEAAQYLDHEKSNEALWNKKISALRDSYKAKEQEKIDELSLIEAEKTKENQKAFADSIVGTVRDLKKIESFDLEDEDREKIVEFILGADATGTNYLYKALQDPENLSKVAWFLLDGEKSINALNNYWANVVKEHSKANYDEGFKAAKTGKTPKISIKNTTKSTSKGSKEPNFISLNSDIPILDLDI